MPRMGRLFWKFFLIVWLAQAAAITGTSAYIFWHESQHPHHHPLPPPGPGPENGFHPPPPPMPGPPPPILHMLTGFLASLVSAAGIAAYIARPINRLKSAIQAASEGQLDTRTGASLGKRKDELTELAHEFDRMTARLGQAMTAQTRLLHDVSHELRSPLARMQAAIGLARQAPERNAESMDRIEREGERMNHLVGELLTLSRLEVGLATKPEHIDPNEVLADLLEDARFEAAQRNIHIEWRAPPCTPSLHMDAELLHRALENILRNALRHAPEQSTIRLEQQVVADDCQISILDTGPGVPPEDLERIFEPFCRLNNKGEGYGLGLTIAQRIISSSGGNIRAENRPGGGLGIHITLPCRPSASAPEQPAA